MNLQTPDVRLADRLVAVTEERDHYKRELGILRDSDDEALVGSRLGLTEREAAMLMILYARRGRVVTKEALLVAMYIGRDEPDMKIIDVFICRVRKKIGPACIDTVWTRGVILTPAGVARVEEAMTVGSC